MSVITEHVVLMSLVLHLKLAKMENPFKEAQKGCVLCSVTVDYKNIQVRTEAPESCDWVRLSVGAGQ